ncbi:MAG: gliding motility lipoprotein GldH [Bacteroidia bacterium]|jgi:gliding motility-associated lipoprotein GldH
MNVNRIIVPIVLSAVLFFSSCDSKRIFEDNVEIPDNMWNVHNIVKLEVDITDTVAPANFYINVRNADGYPYGNLQLFIKTTFPNNQFSVDTLECILADEKGQWLGNGMGDIYDNQIPFKRHVRFPVTGKYTFELQHAMRVTDLPLIMDVGLRIEKAN